MKFVKTIRFKLTLWYSTFLILLSVFYILSLNLAVAHTITREPILPTGRIPPRLQFLKGRIEELTARQREVVQAVRREDLRNLQILSIISIFPLVGLSFAGGYLIAGRTLRPIRDINDNIKAMSATDLEGKLKIDTGEDELGELIDSFNGLRARLHESFELQKQFIENASHELKTPLAVITTNLQVAQQDKSKLQESLKRAVNSARFLDRLIEDLLLLSLLDKQVPKTTVKIEAIIKQAVEQVQPLAKNSDQEITYSLKPILKDLEVYGSKTFLVRAIMNLLENAIRYSELEIRLEAYKIHGTVAISVTDKGVGIRKKEQAKIYERFYRVDKSRSRRSGGSGLGLSIVRRIVELHGGRISVNSVPGVATEFTISLPLA